MILDLKMLVGVRSNAGQAYSAQSASKLGTEANGNILVITDEDKLHDINYSFTPNDEFLPGASKISVSGKLKVASSMVYLDLMVAFSLTKSCDRCTAEFTKEYTLPVNHVLVTSLNTDSYDDAFIVIEDSWLDLDELITTDIELSLPMKHLCKEDCKGICQKCGKNLNEGDCDCSDTEIDPRLAALSRLLEN